MHEGAPVKTHDWLQEHQSHVEDAAVAKHLFDDLVNQNDPISSYFEGALPCGELPPSGVSSILGQNDFARSKLTDVY